MPLNIEQSCTRKIRYETIEAAADFKTWTRRRLGTRMQIYACEFCHGFHLAQAIKWWATPSS